MSAQYKMDISQNAHVEELFELADWVEICQANPDIAAGKIQRMIDGLVRKVATKTTQQAIVHTGKWNSLVAGVNPSDELVVQTLNSIASNELAPYTMEDIDLALMQTNYCQPPAIFSGTTLYKYFRRALAGCCTNQGVDLSQIMSQYGRAVAYDKRVAAALGSENKAIVLQSGSLAMLTYTANSSLEGLEGLYGSGTIARRMVIQDPQSGLPIDLNIKEDCGFIHVNMIATTEVVGLPNDLYHVGDEQRGVKFFNKILVTNS